MKKLIKISNNIPLQEVRIFGLPDQAGPHHNRLEALSFDGP